MLPKSDTCTKCAVRLRTGVAGFRRTSAHFAGSAATLRGTELLRAGRTVTARLHPQVGACMKAGATSAGTSRRLAIMLRS